MTPSTPKDSDFPFSPDELILIGRITRTQGHRGAVRMVPEFDPVERFEGLPGNTLIIRKPAVGKLAPQFSVLHMSEFSFHQQCVILEFEEIADMSAAEELRGAEVYARESELWPLDANEFLPHQLAGLKLSDSDTGESLGEVVRVEYGTGQDFLRVRGGAGEFLVPIVKEFIKEVNLEAGLIRVKLPEGLDKI